MKKHLPVIVTSIAIILGLAGCDSVGSADTVILSANQDIPPTVEYRFRYTSENVSNDGQQVQVVSENTDNLDSVLRDNGFGRADITSARIDSVKMERQSSPEQIRAKVFEYLSEARVFLGTDATGTEIANRVPLPFQEEVIMDVSTSDVTDEIKSGSKNAFLQMETDDTVPQEDRIEVTVFYRIEVQV